MKKLKHLSLFAGGGGIDVGFKWAGIETIAAVEIANYACETLKINNPETYIFGPNDEETNGDIRKFNSYIFQKRFGEIEVDIISGGPPCQPFSIATGQRFGKEDERYKRLGDKDPERGNLLPEFIRIINEIRPKVFVLENVGELINWNSGTYLKESLLELDPEYVYSIPSIVHAVKFGVPQYRERMVIIGTKNTKKLPPFNDYIYKINKEFTVDDALSEFLEKPLNHQVRKHNPETVARYAKLSYGERDYKGRVDKLDPSKPSKTIIGGGDKGGGRSHLHPYLPRTLSPRESARLQTFPDDYEFFGPMGRQFTQIGNAVPPLLAYFISRYIKQYIFDIDTNICEELKNIKHPVVREIPKYFEDGKIQNSQKIVEQLTLTL